MKLQWPADSKGKMPTTKSNAASKADVDTRLTTIQTAINAILANLEAAGINATA